MDDDTDDRLLLAVLTFTGFVSALPILGLIAGAAAFGGINLAVALYIFLAGFGAIGLLLGTFTAFLKCSIFVWITACSAFSIALLSLLFSCGFLFARTNGEQLSSPLYIGRTPFPILALYGFALLDGTVVTWLCAKKIRAEKT
jgi:hypothetical protein